MAIDAFIIEEEIVVAAGGHAEVVLEVEILSVIAGEAESGGAAAGETVGITGIAKARDHVVDVEVEWTGGEAAVIEEVIVVDAGKTISGSIFTCCARLGAGSASKTQSIRKISTQTLGHAQIIGSI